LAILVFFIKEKLDNRVYHHEIPATEVPLAFHGQLVLAGTVTSSNLSRNSFVVHDASTGATTPLPPTAISEHSYRMDSPCAAGDEIVLQRSDENSDDLSYLVFDRFRWSTEGVALIATYEIERNNDKSLAMDPWTCEIGQGNVPGTYSLENGRSGAPQTLTLEGAGRVWAVTLPKPGDAGILRAAIQPACPSPSSC
jgi:hypothetical protein